MALLAWQHCGSLAAPIRVCCHRLVGEEQNSEEEGSSRKEGYRVQDSPESEPFIIFFKKKKPWNLFVFLKMQE